MNMINRSHLILIILLQRQVPACLCQRVFELSCDASSLFLQTAASAPRQIETHTNAHTKQQQHGPTSTCALFCLGRKEKKGRPLQDFPTLKRTFFQDSCSIPTEQTLQFMRMVGKKKKNSFNGAPCWRHCCSPV